MSRYIQESLETDKEDTKEEREMPKAGKYSLEDLESTKTPTWSRGSMNG